MTDRPGEGWRPRHGLHFLLLGGLLFLAERWAPPVALPSRPEEARAIVITTARLAALREELRAAVGDRVQALDDATLVRGLVDDELLYREAVVRGLDRDDRSVRYRLLEKMHFLRPETKGGDADALYREAVALGLDRQDAIVRRLLVEKMRLLTAATVATETVDDATLAAFHAAHAERYQQPARMALAHVYLSRTAHGDGLGRDAARILVELRAAQPSLDEAVRRGDPFPLGHRFPHASERHLTKLFGADFARNALRAPAGTWTGPIASPFGLHLVRVDELVPAGTAPFDAVRARVVEDYREMRRVAVVQALLTDLRARYAIRVESGATRERS